MKLAKRMSAIAVLLAALALSTMSVGDAAAAVSPVRISKVFYDPAGTDTRTNAHLNLEYVVITNTSAKTQPLTRWTLRDAQNHVFTFPAFTLGAGRSVTVHTGKGTASSAHRYFNSGNYIWNNTADTAVLKNAANATMSTCAWKTHAAGGYKSC